jgi:arginase
MSRWGNEIMRPVRIIYVPYDSGRAGERFGRGPLKARDSGLASRLSASLPVSEQIVMHGGFFPTEGTAAFDLARRISHLVAEARSQEAFPIVVAGNCISSLGTVSGMGGARRAVVWLDAHPDFHTPDTTSTAFLDGMGSAILAGEAWRVAARTVPHFRPIDRDHLLFIGARDIDPEEAARLSDPPVAVFSGDDYRADKPAVHSALAALGDMSDAAYLHFDMDVTEPSPVPANEFAAAGGFDDGEVASLLEAIADRVPIAAAGVTAYDPGLDTDGSMLTRYLSVIEQLAMLGAR